jgi:hypothetical protein
MPHFGSGEIARDRSSVLVVIAASARPAKIEAADRIQAFDRGFAAKACRMSSFFAGSRKFSCRRSQFRFSIRKADSGNAVSYATTIPRYRAVSFL